ncbi:MAG: DUF2069 domain-containing protein [Halofilum sp. (in: g-proteobacteria)]|nr:DUF2069 domain-containing protein [Halofilum sp. (in: g-proteobacteria)]
MLSLLRRPQPWRVLALTAYFALLLLLLNGLTWIAPPEGLPPAFALIVLAGPLLLPLHGLLRAKSYTHAWTSLLSLLYFALGIDALAAGQAPPWLAWATIVASLALFTGCVGYVRANARASVDPSE